jgi:error-prone DNA polymerase
MLLEDETGTVNLIVPPAVYARERLVVRTEPLVIAEGKLERFASAGGAINVLVRSIAALDTPGDSRNAPPAVVHDFSPLDARELEAAAVGEATAVGEAAAVGGEVVGFRAVAPAVMSFAAGRRR